MSTENNETPVVSEMDDLDAFSAELYGQNTAVSDETTSEDVEDVTPDDDANTEETQANETETLDTDDDNAEDDSDEEEAHEKPKSRAQKRFDELTRKAKEAERREKDAERREEALRSEFEALKAELNKPKNDTSAPVKEVAGPAPDDTNEDGTEKYPLGEFDPHYIRDLTKFTLLQEKEAMKIEEEKASRQKEFEAERLALNEGWKEKLGPAQERYPDFQEKGEDLFDTFSKIPHSYGEYLTATIMSMDHGPDVLYYLANNLDEAKKIVDSGPTRASLSLGRIESKFADVVAEKQLQRPKVSNAPPPPNAQLQGMNAVMPEVADDTDDLDAFSAKLYKPLKKVKK